TDQGARLEDGRRVGQGVDQVAVVVPPPQQHHVDHVVSVLPDELLPGDLDDVVAEVPVAVLVVPELLDHRPGLEPEALGRTRTTAGVRTLAVRAVGGRSHQFLLDRQYRIPNRGVSASRKYHAPPGRGVAPPPRSVPPPPPCVEARGA